MISIQNSGADLGIFNDSSESFFSINLEPILEGQKFSVGFKTPEGLSKMLVLLILSVKKHNLQSDGYSWDVFDEIQIEADIRESSDDTGGTKSAQKYTFILKEGDLPYEFSGL